MPLSAHVLQGLANSSTTPDELERYQAHALPIDFSLPSGETFDGQNALILELRLKGVPGLEGRLQTVVMANPTGSTARLILTSPQLNQPVTNAAGEAVASKKFWLVLCAVAGETITPLWTANLKLVAHFASASTAAPPAVPAYYLTAAQASGLYATIAALAAEIAAREAQHSQVLTSLAALDAAVATKASLGALDAETAARQALSITVDGKASQTALAAEITARVAAVNDLLASLALKSPLASPSFTGNPTAPTQSTSDNTTKLATTAMVQARIGEVIAGAPANLDTLHEIADQLQSEGDALSALISTVSGKLAAAENLSDLNDAATARANLGAAAQTEMETNFYSLNQLIQNLNDSLGMVQNAIQAIGEEITLIETNNTGINTGDQFFDQLSPLVSAEIPITGATTATIGRMHACSGTAGNNTVTLPPAAGNAGRLIGIRMAASLTTIVTIDGSGSELIDGAQTRAMWRNEVAVLLCDGVGWTKVGGKSIPLQCIISPSSNQAIAPFTITLINCDYTNVDNSGSMADLPNHRIVILRSGQYYVRGIINYATLAGNTLFQNRVHLNGGDLLGTSATLGVTNYAAFPVSSIEAISAGSYLDLRGYHEAAINYSAYGHPIFTQLAVTEQVTW